MLVSRAESTSYVCVGYLMTSMQDDLFEKLAVLEQLKKQNVVDVVMIREIKLAEFEECQ